MELIDGLQKHQKLQKLLEKVERRINEGDPDDAALNMRKILEYITTQYMKEYAQRLAKEDLFGTIKGLESAGILSRETVSLFHKIRMAGNDSGAHFKEEEGSLKKTQSLYKQLLAYIPSFLEDFPEPSKKEVTDNPFNIDYMSITPLLIEFSNYENNLGFADWYDYEPWQYWENSEGFRDEYDSLEWLKDPSIDPERYFYTEGNLSYVNRLQLVIDTEDDIKSLITSGECNRIWDNSIYVPGIIQQYFGFSRVVVTEEEEEVKGSNGMTATRRGKLKKKVNYYPMNVSRIIFELAAFGTEVEIPEGVKVVDNLEYEKIFKNIKVVHLPSTILANQDFRWLNLFNQPNFLVERDAEIYIKNRIVYTRDKKKLIYAMNKTTSPYSPFRVPDEVQCIGKGAFKHANMKTIFLNNVKRIEDEAFAYCNNLIWVLSVCHLEEIGKNAFRDCKLLQTSEFTAIINNGITKIEADAFEGCPEPKEELPNKSYTFKNSFQLKPTGRTISVSGLRKEEKEKITEVIIPEGITHISGCDGIPARKIILPSTLTSINNLVSVYLQELYLPDGVRSIGVSAFANSIKLKKVRIPDTVKEIYETSFKNCVSLEEVEVPERFRYVFKAYPNIKFTTPEPPSKDFLEELDKQFIRYQDTKTFHQTCDNYTNEMLEKVRQKTVIKASLISNKKDTLIYDKLPEKSCTLKVDIPADAAKDITIVERLSPINRNMYTELIIPEGLTHCPTHLGWVYHGLRRIYFPSTLISIDTEAFCGSRLQEVYLPDGVMFIEARAFASNSQLKRLRIPNTVERIYETSFENCPSLEEVDVPERYRYLFEGYPNVKFTTIEPPSKRTIIEQNEQPIQNQNIENTHQTDTSSVKEVAKEAEQPHIEEKSLPFFQKLKRTFTK